MVDNNNKRNTHSNRNFVHRRQDMTKTTKIEAQQTAHSRIEWMVSTITRNRKNANDVRTNEKIKKQMK